MKRFGLVPVCLLLLVTSANADVPRSAKSVAVDAAVQVLDGRGSGSGVIVSQSGTRVSVLTCAHVVRSGSVQVRFRNSLYDAEVVRIDRGRDLALVRFSSRSKFTPVPICRKGAADPTPFQAVAASYDSGELAYRTISIIDDDGSHWVANRPFVPGMSGSGLIDEDGFLVGIIDMTSPRNGLAIHLTEIHNFLYGR